MQSIHDISLNFTSYPNISPLEREEAQSVRKRFRAKFACHYIPDINKIRKQMRIAMDPKQLEAYRQKVEIIASQFAHITFEVPHSQEAYDMKNYQDYDTIIHWPLIEVFFPFPFIVEKYNISHLTFKNNYFQARAEFSYFTLIPRNQKKTTSYLRELGYELLGNVGDFSKVGNFVSFTFPFNNSDEIFFISKHFFYYHFYSLMQHLERPPGTLYKLVRGLLRVLRDMVGGFFIIKGDIREFSLCTLIDTPKILNEVYDKHIFANAREFTKLYRQFLFAMQTLSSKKFR